MNNNLKFKKSRLIVIVGGTGGIGLRIAKSFLVNGERVCITYYKDKSYMKKIFFQNNSNRCFAYQVDVRNDTSVKNVFKKIYIDHGNIDVIIFAPTAQTHFKAFPDKEWANFKEHLDVQIKGLYLVVKNTINQIIEKKYKIKFIILLTECCISTPPAFLSDYITAKYGLMGLAKCLSVELAKYNCTVNMISPGMTETNLLSNLPKKLIEITATKNLFKRIAKPEDVANATLFLASEGSGYLNGVNITVNGGNIML